MHVARERNVMVGYEMTRTSSRCEKGDYGGHIKNSTHRCFSEKRRQHEEMRENSPERLAKQNERSISSFRQNEISFTLLLYDLIFFKQRHGEKGAFLNPKQLHRCQILTASARPERRRASLLAGHPAQEFLRTVNNRRRVPAASVDTCGGGA